MLSMEDKEKQLEFLRNLSDEEAYQNALNDPDCPPLTDLDDIEIIAKKDIQPGESIIEKFKNLHTKQNKQLVTIRFDADVLDYFKLKGKGYQSMMNDALRAFMEAEKACHGSG